MRPKESGNTEWKSNVSKVYIGQTGSTGNLLNDILK